MLRSTSNESRGTMFLPLSLFLLGTSCLARKAPITLGVPLGRKLENNRSNNARHSARTKLKDRTCKGQIWLLCSLWLDLPLRTTFCALNLVKISFIKNSALPWIPHLLSQPLMRLCTITKRICISQFQQCPSLPRELAFFENELANALPPEQKKFFKCPGVGVQKCFISFVSRLSFNKV